jgi:hypothetical protein
VQQMNKQTFTRGGPEGAPSTTADRPRVGCSSVEGAPLRSGSRLSTNHRSCVPLNAAKARKCRVSPVRYLDISNDRLRRKTTYACIRTTHVPRLLKIALPPSSHRQSGPGYQKFMRKHSQVFIVTGSPAGLLTSPRTPHPLGPNLLISLIIILLADVKPGYA